MNARLPVSLRAVVREMDVFGDDWAAYLNRKTGEIVSVNDEAIRLVEDDEEPEELDDGSSEWSDEELAIARAVVESSDYLRLPGRDEFEEHRIMTAFAAAQEDDALREDLLCALAGRGAFRRFKDLVIARGRAEAWYAWRDEALAEIAAGWLEVNGIVFVRDLGCAGGTPP